MPKELRKVVFTRDELQAAAVAYCYRQGMKLPKGMLQSVTFENEQVSLNFSVISEKGPTRIRLTRDQIAAAIILYCRSLRIPIPKQSQKIVNPDGDGIALLVSLQYEKSATAA
jgi:hypothetical protein